MYETIYIFIENLFTANFIYFQNYSVEILHFPLILAPVTNSLYLLPGYSDLFPLLESDVPKIAQFQQEFMRSEKIKPVENLSKYSD